MNSTFVNLGKTNPDFPNSNYKGAYGCRYFPTATIRVTRSKFFTKRGYINGACEWPQL